jgi:hypothetical protein
VCVNARELRSICALIAVPGKAEVGSPSSLAHPSKLLLLQLLVARFRFRDAESNMSVYSLGVE